MSAQQHALDLVQLAVDKHQRPPTKFDPSKVRLVNVGELLSTLPEPVGDSDFVNACNRWLDSAKALRDAGFGDGDAWSRIGKPWLTNLVGWSALSETGRAAGSRGYALLTEAYMAHWDEEQAEARP